MGIIREERFGNARLILGDCREIVGDLQPVDAIVSDPPYGQRQNTNVRGVGGGPTRPPPRAAADYADRVALARRKVRTGGAAGTLHRSGLATEWPEGIAGDDEPFDPAPWLKAAPRVLLWGAHRFHARLPLGSWLVWDKRPTGKVNDQGDGEAAWVNDLPPRPMRLYRLLWDGVCVGSAARDEVGNGQARVHPAQKPISLMSWCLAQMRLPPGSLILDPYMGSGSTVVAALKAGHPSIGIEIEPLYYETACRRVAEEARQMTLALSAPAAAHAQ